MRTYRTSSRLLVPVAVATALLGSGAASAAITSVDLSNYSLIGTFVLPAGVASEASAVTYNWDTGTLFVLGDEGDAVAEVTKQGALVSSMTFSSPTFADTEGLTYIGGGQFVLVEERLQTLYKFSYAPGGSLNPTTLQSADLDGMVFGVGNIGTEGVSFDPRDGTFVTVKEVGPQEVRRHTVNFGTGAATTTSIFNPAGLGVADLSDVQVLAVVPSLLGTADEGNFLIFSQESRRLLEVSPTGAVLSAFNFAASVDNAEGVTIDSDGIIYVVDETLGAGESGPPAMYVLAPVPLPAAVWLLGSGLFGAAGVLRRRRAEHAAA